MIGGWTGRNFGWKENEKQTALDQIARTIRADPEYERAFSAVSERWKLNLRTASDDDIRTRAAQLVSEFIRSLRFSRKAAYDSFLKLNGLPESPRRGETLAAYTDRLREAVTHLKVPSLAQRAKDPLPYLGAQAQFRNEADLGVWLVFANPEIPKPQSTLCRLMSGRESCDPAEWLPKALGRFKTPTLRNTSVREPYFHTGRHVRLESAIQHYAVASAFERLGELVNPPPEFKGMQLTGFEVAPLAAFLRSLDENSK